MKYTFAIFLVAFGTVSTMTAQIGSHPMRAQAASASGQPTGRPVARVNGAVLTDRDLQREMFTIFPYARQHNGGIPKAMEPQIRQGAMRMMIFEELVYQEAKRRKMVIPPAKLDHAMAEFRKQFSSDQDFHAFLNTELQGSTQLLRTKVERSLLIDEMLKKEVVDKAAISDAQLRAYYQRNPTRFVTPESYAIQTISVFPPDKATPAQLKETKKRADDMFRQAKATHNYDEFGSLAEKVSQDDYRVMMGDHHSVDRTKMPPEILKAISLMQPGQVSDLLQVGPFYCVVRLNQHIPSGKQKFDTVKVSLREELERKRTEELRSSLNKKLRATAKVEEL